MPERSGGVRSRPGAKSPATAYKTAERRAQGRWKLEVASCEEMPLDARQKGTWRGIEQDYFLPASSANCNLWLAIRDELLSFFETYDIAWHEEDTKDYGTRTSRGPSPNLLDSQVCALNFWWGLARSPAALAATLRTIVPELVGVEPPGPSGALAEPEWIGRSGTNYLGEKGRHRRRGKFATSADLLFVYRDRSGQRHGILLESKYTEDYRDAAFQPRSPFGTSRIQIYEPAFASPWSPFRREGALTVPDLLIEPFDQHLRQQLLAAAAEQDGELGLSTVTCVHVCPRANRAFHEVITAPALQSAGATVAEVWGSLLTQPSRYRSAAYEDVFAAAEAIRDPALAAWYAYQRDRYRWGARAAT